MFLAPHFFEGAPPEFLKSIYKIQSHSDHVVKFQGDRSRELGESVAKQKKTFGAEYKPVRNGGSGRPKNRRPGGDNFTNAQTRRLILLNRLTLTFACSVVLMTYRRNQLCKLF